MADNRVRLYGQNGPGLTRNYAYNSSSNNNSNNNGRSREARELNNLIHMIYGGGPQSPGRKPKAVNVSKYQKMLNNLENKNKNKNKNNNNNSNSNSNSNKNVV